MKAKKTFLIVVVTVLCMGKVNSQIVSLVDTILYTQTTEQEDDEMTEEEYSELASLFAVDVQMMGNTRESYDNYQSTRLRLPFSSSTVLTLNTFPNRNTDINKILVIVNSSIYNQLSEKIERYAYDINYVYGCEVIMKIVTGGDHTNIKSLITSNKTNLDGAVFIGDIAAAFYEVANDYDGYAGWEDKEGYGYAEFPCDLYYMDLDGTWTDADGDGKYDAHTGNVKPEIFVGRISTANMGKLLSEKEGLESYLDKNHKFWMGYTTVNKKFGLTYTDTDIWAANNHFKTDIKKLYGSSNYDIVKYGDAVFGKTDYLDRLTDNRYEFIQLACHASYDHLGMSGGGIYSNEIFNNDIQSIGYNLYCCSACNWTVVLPNSSQGFLAGSHVYNTSNSSLVVVGSAKTGGMLKFAKFYTPLGNSKTMGESLKQWWINANGNSHANKIIYYHYGMTIIGDPMVNFFHCTDCVSQITLNSFDNSNPSSHRYIIARDRIIVNNYVIPAGKHVIFNAKEVEFNSGFECQLGGSFEVINEGCMSNCQ